MIRAFKRIEPEPKKERSDADKKRLAHGGPHGDPDADFDSQGLGLDEEGALPTTTTLGGLDNDMYGHRPRKERSLEDKLRLAHQDPSHDHDVRLTELAPLTLSDGAICRPQPLSDL
jgi:hypothetical protein